MTRELLHGNGCPLCQRVRRQRRAQVLRAAYPWVATLGVVLVLGFLEWLLR